MLGLAGAVVAAAFVLGGLLVGKPGVVLPLTLEAMFLFGLTLLLLRREKDVAQRRWLVRMLVLAGALRGFVAFLIYGVLDPILFAPDTASYYAQGLSIVRFWQGGPRPEIVDQWQSGYAYLNALAIKLLDDPTWFVVVLNAFASLWTAVFTYFLTRRCFGVKAARIASLLVAAFPSMVLWSVLNVRDSLTTCLVVFLVFLAVRSYRSLNLVDVVLFVGGAVLLSTLRDYMGFLVMAGVGLGMVMALRPDRMASTLVIGTAAVLGLTLTLEQSGVFGPEVLRDPFQHAETLRRGLQGDFRGGLAGSAYGVDVEIRGAGDALRYLPIGLVFFLFAPFPWAIRSTLQVLTLPEVLLWYSIAPFTLAGIRQSLKPQHRDAVVVFSVLMLVVSSYALVEGNFGTAYRHRAQVMPLFFTFAAHGVAAWIARRSSEERAKIRRRSRARLWAMGHLPDRSRGP